MIIEATFGQIVRERRLVLGLTQAELARRVNCATVTIRKIEYDNLRPSVQVAERLALSLNIPEAEQLAFVRLARTDLPQTPIPTPAPMPEEIGQEDLSGRSVHGYELGERIGTGGFGVVYRAVQPSVDRDVAIKIILPEYANHPNFIRRFEVEAQTVAQLEHPHIVPLYDYWREPNAAYLIMRLLRGGSLESKIKRGPLPLEVVNRYLQQIGQGLHLAHRNGVIHRDLKPANVLLDEDDNAYLADFGIAKHLDEWTAVDKTEVGALVGSPAYASPEQLRAERIKPQTDIYCLGIMLYELLAGERPFPGPTPILYIQQHLFELLPPICQQNAALPPALDEILLRATAKDSAERYPDVLTFLAELQPVLLGSNGRSTPITLTESTFPLLSTQEIANLENPFKGLRAFSEADSDSFFGRDSLVHDLLGRIGDSVNGGQDLTRFLAVVGPSGSGKSSVVRAGLLPALRQGGVPGSEGWFMVDMMPSAKPMAELAAALLRVAVHPPGNLLEQLQFDERGLLRVLEQILPDDSTTELLLVIDQFEETFTLVADEATRVHFLDSLVTAVLDERSRLRVVVTLRADFTDRPLQYVDFGELVRKRTEFVLPLSPDELEEAITRPITQLGLILEPGLAAQIIRDVGDEPGTLPLLQYALTELFERRGGMVLTRTAYETSGGVLGALARRAEEIYAKLDVTAQEATRQLFFRLVTLGEGVEDTRRRVLLSELEALSVNGNPSSVNGKTSTDYGLPITEYGKYRLLTFDHDPVTREPTVEVAHEALLREWGRLRDWLTESRDDVRLQRLLANEARGWQTADHDPSYHLRGARLVQFEGWLATTTIALTQSEQAFVQASLTAREQLQAQEEARRQRELATAQQLAKTEHSRAEEQSVSAQNLRRRAVYLGMAALVAVVLAVAAGLFSRQATVNEAVAVGNAATAVAEGQRADAQRDAALSAQATSVADAQALATAQVEVGLQRDTAVAAQATTQAEALIRATAEAEAIAQRDTAQTQTNLATSRELSLAALTNLEADSELSILLALQALDTSYTKEAEEALHQGLQTSRLLMTLSGHTDRVYAAVYSPDGSYLATVSDDDTVKVWQAESGQLLLTLPYQGFDFLKSTLMFDNASRRLALVTVSADFESAILHIWNVASGELFNQKELPIHVENFSLALSPDWQLIAAGFENGNTELWDVESAEKLLVISSPDAASTVLFSPDGSRLVTASFNSGQVRVWDVEASLTGREGQTIASFEAVNDQNLTEAIFSTDGTRLVLLFNDSAVEVWNLADMSQPPTNLIGHTNWISYAAFDANDSRLATGGTDGTAKVWDLSTGEEIMTLSGHQGFVYRPSFSPDGQRLATASQDGTARIWNVQSQAGGELLTLVNSGISDFMDMELSPDERKVALGSNVGAATVWDAVTGELLLTLTGDTGTRVYRVSFNPDGSRIATVGEDGMVRIWDAETGDLLLAFVGHMGGNAGGFTGTLDVSYSPDGLELATAGADGVAKVWDAETGEALLALVGHTAGLHSLAYSPDGRYIATSSNTDDTTVKVWDAHSGDEVYTFGPNPGRAWGLAFSPNSTLVAAGGQGGYITIWDVTTGEEVIKMIGQSATVGTVAFTLDGQRLISGGVESASIWDIATGTELLNLSPQNSWKVALTHDGQRLYVADFLTPSIRVYSVPLEATVALAQSRVTRPLTEAECQQYLHQDTCPEPPDR